MSKWLTANILYICKMWYKKSPKLHKFNYWLSIKLSTKLLKFWMWQLCWAMPFLSNVKKGNINDFRTIMYEGNDKFLCSILWLMPYCPLQSIVYQLNKNKNKTALWLLISNSLILGTDRKGQKIRLGLKSEIKYKRITEPIIHVRKYVCYLNILQ